MQKIFIIIFICLISLNNFSNLSAKMYKSGTVFEKEIKFTKNFVLPVSDGKWEVVNSYNFYYYFPFKGNSIIRVENNEAIEFIWVEKARLAGEAMGWIDHAVNEITFKDKYDGCYERPEYYLLKVYRKGGTHNCLIISHIETNKEIFTPDDPLDNNAELKQYIKENSIILPPIMFSSRHSYFSRLIRGEWYVIRYFANPKIFNSPKLNYLTEESSEFHKANISRFPEHKKTMDKWISFSSKRHKTLEKLFNSKQHHLLNLDKYILENDIDSTKDARGNKTLVEDLEKLNELYKTGAITKEEFEKAKDRILN